MAIRHARRCAAVRERLEKEIKVIAGKGFSSYFLIVWDFCNYARDNGIPSAPRGSGVGTMVGYLLGLCNVDPIKYGLLFERFMDPSRSEMPDIDIDICQDGRQGVIEYVRKSTATSRRSSRSAHLPPRQCVKTSVACWACRWR